jgi:hypothetical protein
MTAPADVLAVYDDCIAKMEYHYRNTRAGDEMRAGRAALAELIAAARDRQNDYRDPETESADAYDARMRKAVKRLDAALARVGGAK